MLVEDVPGVGKTTLAKALARAFRVTFTRVQFTPDLLPSDILGSQVLNPREGTFAFHAGPVFTNVLLADEINRASPRTQSALLEAMSEAQVTVDGITHLLPRRSSCSRRRTRSTTRARIRCPRRSSTASCCGSASATPDPKTSSQMLFARQRANPLDAVEAVADVARPRWRIQAAVREIEMKESRRAVPARASCAATRDHADLELGVSPRGALAFFRAAQARALLAGPHATSAPTTCRRSPARCSRTASCSPRRRATAARRPTRCSRGIVATCRAHAGPHVKINFARLNHILIPSTKAARDRLREARSGTRAPASRRASTARSATRGATLATALVHRRRLRPRRARERGLPALGRASSALLARLAARATASIASTPCPRRGRACPARHHRRRGSRSPLVLRNDGARIAHAMRVRGPFLPWDGRWTGERRGSPCLAERTAAPASRPRARFVARGEHHLDPFSRRRAGPARPRARPARSSSTGVQLPGGPEDRPRASA